MARNKVVSEVYYITLRDLIDESGDTDLFIPSGAKLDFVSNEGSYLILATEDGTQFPVDFADVLPTVEIKGRFGVQRRIYHG